MGMWKRTGKIVRTPGKILVMPLPTVCVAPSLQTLPNIKIIDYLTHLEFRACSLIAFNGPSIASRETELNIPLLTRYTRA